LLVLRRGEIEHRVFTDLPQYLNAGDVLVLNETRVIAARIVCHGEESKDPEESKGSKGIEILVLRPANAARYDPNATRWHALVKPGRKMREGREVSFGELGSARVIAVHDGGIREIDFALNVPFEEFLARAGRMPLPPYIHNDSAQAQERYQTVFAREPGSVAAPTASLHFTQSVLDAIAVKGVEIVKLVLDVGLGTFRPVQTQTLDEHRMHSESFSIPEPTVDAIARAKAQGRRVIAAGTTVTRALEGSASKHGLLQAGAGETSIFITPGFRFAVVDALITNFHLPQSTLLVLVSALAGRETILGAYREAVSKEYRFFSFGDAMFIER
jgi:S-adenosylmethionine:tRNA ribosyltransferase-isomerase